MLFFLTPATFIRIIHNLRELFFTFVRNKKIKLDLKYPIMSFPCVGLVKKKEEKL